MFEEYERMQDYYHYLRQTAGELAQQADQLRGQAYMSLTGVYPERDSDELRKKAEETCHHLIQICEYLEAQAHDVKKWLDQAALMMPPPSSLKF